MVNRILALGELKDTDRQVFISYLNDSGEIISGFVILIELGDYVIFRTNENKLTIPRERVLKIKEKL